MEMVESQHTMNFQKINQNNDSNDFLKSFKNLDDNFSIHRVNFNKKLVINFNYYHNNTFNFFKYYNLILLWKIFNYNLVIILINQIDKLFFKTFIDNVSKNSYITIASCYTFL